MTDSPLGAPPKALTRDEVLARIHRKDKQVTVEGYGEYRYRSLSLDEVQAINELCTKDGVQDKSLVNGYVVARSFPDLFTDADAVTLSEGDALATIPFLAAIGSGGFEVPPSTFHGGAKPRVRGRTKPRVGNDTRGDAE